MQQLPIFCDILELDRTIACYSDGLYAIDIQYRNLSPQSELKKVSMLPLAIIFITAALILYTIGVWAERRAQLLKPWHLAMFWAGFVCDTTGTSLMVSLAKGQLTSGFHAITGLIAIVLMAAHALWASYVLIRGSKKSKQSFHRFSITVWAIWLIPYISGLIFGMMSH